MKLVLGCIKHRVCGILKEFTGDEWEDLPQGCGAGSLLSNVKMPFRRNATPIHQRVCLALGPQPTGRPEGISV